jgi:5-methylcytosine-specific restriction endonuclease McrA
MAVKTKPRTRNSGKWTEARYWSFIRSALRGAMNKWGPKHAAKELARKGVIGKRHRFEYKCAKCNKYHKGDEVQVDHIVPCGSLKQYSDLPGFVERAFCEVEGFMILCKPCHQIKTNYERGHQ